MGINQASVVGEEVDGEVEQVEQVVVVTEVVVEEEVVEVSHASIHPSVAMALAKAGSQKFRTTDQLILLSSSSCYRHVRSGW